MPTKIEITPAPEADAIVVDLIGQCHPHLANTGILCLFTTQARKEDRKPVAATVHRLTPRERFLASGSTREGDEFVILINIDSWRQLLKPQRVALMDHELCHLVEQEADEEDDPDEGPSIVWSPGHDIQVFADEVRRHGAWNEDIAIVAKQLRLFEAENVTVETQELQVAAGRR